jgi:hypothetical protein
MLVSDCSPYPHNSRDYQQAPHLQPARATLLSKDKALISKYDKRRT